MSSVGTITAEMVFKTDKMEQDARRASNVLKSSTNEMKRGLAGVTTETQKTAAAMKVFDNSISGLKQGIIGAIGGLGLMGLYVGFKRINMEAGRWEQRMLRTGALIRATGNAAGFTAKQLGDFAKEMDLSTLGDREGILDAINVLQTFRSVSGETFKEAIRLASDLSTVYGTDLRSSTVQLGKALQDPIRGITALRRNGVDFTDQQKEQIKVLVESGQLLKAQGIILEEVSRQIGGSAKGEASGLVGAVDTLTYRWRDLREEFASTTYAKEEVDRLAKGVQDLTQFVKDLKALGNWFTGGSGQSIAAFTGFLDMPTAREAEAAMDQYRSPDQAGKRFPIDYDNVVGGNAPPPPVTPPKPIGSMDNGISEAERLTQAIDRQVQALQFQAEHLGKSADQIALLKLENEGATPAQLKAAEAALSTISAYEALEQSTKELVEAQEEINAQATAIEEQLLTEEENILRSYERRREIILRNTEITGEAQLELLRRLEQKNNSELEALNQTYWEKWTKAAQDNMQNFDKMSGQVLENLTSSFGQFFETAIFDSENLGESVAKTMEGMARSVVRAIGEMIAQWLIYKAVTGMLGGGGGSVPISGGGFVPGYGARPMGTVAGMHEGGIVGQDSSFVRSVSPSLFDGAKRYHQGGIAGDEVPIIAQKGEAILTNDSYGKLVKALDSMDRMGSEKSTSITVPINIDSGNNAMASELRSEIEITVDRVVRRYL